MSGWSAMLESSSNRSLNFSLSQVLRHKILIRGNRHFECGYHPRRQAISFFGCVENIIALSNSKISSQSLTQPYLHYWLQLFPRYQVMLCFGIINYFRLWKVHTGIMILEFGVRQSFRFCQFLRNKGHQILGSDRFPLNSRYIAVIAGFQYREDRFGNMFMSLFVIGALNRTIVGLEH